MPGASKRPHEERLELRLRHEDKLALLTAARHQGVTVSAYLLAHSLPSARQEAAQAILLPNPARDQLLAILPSLLVSTHYWPGLCAVPKNFMPDRETRWSIVSVQDSP
jgi:uncharacterized protein (DUF1778 family)